MRKETLRAIISAKQTLERSMRQAADGTRDLVRASMEASASTGKLAGIMDASEDQASEYDWQIERLARSSTEAAVKQALMGENVAEAGYHATKAASQALGYAKATDKAGDESARAAAKVNASGDAYSKAGAQAATAAAASQGAAEGFDHVGDEATGSTAQVAGFQGILASLTGQMAATKTMFRGVDMDLPVQTAAKQLKQMASRLEILPDAVVRAASNMDELGLILQHTQKSAKDAVTGIRNIDGVTDGMLDTVIESSDSLKSMQMRLLAEGDAGEAAAKKLDNLDSQTKEFLSTQIAASGGVRELRDEIDKSGDEMIEVAAQAEVLDKKTGGLMKRHLAGAAAAHTYSEGIDRTGDKMAKSTLQGAGLAPLLRNVGEAAGEASVNVGPFNTSVRRAVIALPALIALTGSFIAVLGGLATAAFTATGALTALFAGGFVGKAEEMARHSSDIENRMEAMQELMKRFGSAIDEVTEPLQQLSSQEAAMDLLDGIVTLVGDLARSAKRLEPVFGAVADSLGATFWAEEARGIAEVERMITELMPILEDLAFWILTELPDLIAWLTEETKEVGPAMGDFATSALEVAKELTEIGGIIFRVTLPAISLLLDSVAWILELFSELPAALYAAVGAFAIAATILTIYSGSVSLAAITTFSLTGAVKALIAAIGTLLAPISLTVLAIAALVAAVVGIITYMGWWDDIGRALVDTWNALVEVVEFLINGIIGLANWLDNLLGPLLYFIPVWGQLLWLIANFNEVMDTLRYIVETVTEAWEDFIDVVKDTPFIGEILEEFDELHTNVDASGGVSLDAAKMDYPSAAVEGGPDGGGDGENPGAGRGPRRARERADRGADPDVQRRAQEIRENRTTINVDARGSSMSERQIQKVVERALEKERSRSSDR